MAFVDVNTEVGEFGSDNAVGFDGATKCSRLMWTLAAADVVASLPRQRVRVECVRRNRVNCESTSILIMESFFVKFLSLEEKEAEQGVGEVCIPHLEASSQTCMPKLSL